MFSTVNQPAVQHGLIAEVASSAALQDAVVWVYGSLGVFALVCLVSGYTVTRIIESISLNPTWTPRRRSL